MNSEDSKKNNSDTHKAAGSVESSLQQEDLENQEEQTEPAGEGSNPADDQVKTPEEETLRQAQDKRDEYLAGWQRAQADLQNLKKTHAEERAMFTTLGKESLLQELIPMLDNFDAAFADKDAWESVPETWRIGVEYIQKQFIETLENNGVVAFGVVGDDFDTTMHEPIEMVAGEEKDKNKIVTVIQKGYKIGERIVRPAKVRVGE